jgi:hypothetical protein
MPKEFGTIFLFKDLMYLALLKRRERERERERERPTKFQSIYIWIISIKCLTKSSWLITLSIEAVLEYLNMDCLIKKIKNKKTKASLFFISSGFAAMSY